MTNEDFIDPEEEDLRRVLLSLAWYPGDNQALIFYYLDQADESGSNRVGDIEDIDRVDEEDADLTWFGASYLAGFDLDVAGEIDVELHAAWVDGSETLYEFEEEGGSAELEEIERGDVEGSAVGLLLQWSPAQFSDWRLIVGNARGSGDSRPDDGRDESFRATGLQGDNEGFGELYQPELSNLEVTILGIAWAFSDGVELALMTYEYEQRELAEEMRDVSIDLDTTGESRDLGSEIDLVLTVDARDGMELILIMGEFDAGRAYGDNAGETATFHQG